MEKSGAMYSWGSLLGAWIYYSFCSRFVMRYLTEKDSLSEKEVEKVPGNDYNKG